MLEDIRRFAEALGIGPVKVRIGGRRSSGESRIWREIQMIQNEIKKIVSEGELSIIWQS